MIHGEDSKTYSWWWKLLKHVTLLCNPAHHLFQAFHCTSADRMVSQATARRYEKCNHYYSLWSLAVLVCQQVINLNNKKLFAILSLCLIGGGFLWVEIKSKPWKLLCLLFCPRFKLHQAETAFSFNARTYKIIYKMFPENHLLHIRTDKEVLFKVLLIAVTDYCKYLFDFF